MLSGPYPRLVRNAALLSIVVSFCCSSASRAEEPPRAPAKQIAHETFTLASKALGEPRRIHLYRPPGVASTTPLPVLYLLDGGDDEDFPHPGVLAAIDLAIRAGDMRPLVVVGIENTERRRDMTEPTQVESDKKIAPHVGGAAKFRAFIADELIPRIKREVRVTKSAIAGESLAGLFVLETLFAEPTLFDTWIAISPSLQWNGGALARSARRWLETHPALAGARGRRLRRAHRHVRRRAALERAARAHLVLRAARRSAPREHLRDGGACGDAQALAALLGGGCL